MYSCKPLIHEQAIYPFKIGKIDSLNNYYIVYISNNHKTYQTISRKAGFKCEIIKVKNTYPSFMFEPIIKENDYTPKDRPANYLDFVPNEVKLDSSTIIIRNKGMDNIYSTNNLNGLCYRNLTPIIK